jgi:hypothetical protein
MQKQNIRVLSGEQNRHQVLKCFACDSEGTLLAHFDKQNVIHRDFVDEGTTVNSEFCVNAQEKY